MKVLNYKEQVVNVESNCPSLQRMVDDGAEEIPIEVFGGYERFADNTNTVFVDGAWVFTFDTVAQDAKDQKVLEELDRKNRKLAGVEFEGVMCSATGGDMHGLKCVEDDILEGIPVNFHFDNGNVLVITPGNVEAFKAVWKPFRRSFF